ncbi:LuxR C-terminal-related transcriptional regulator [Pelomonas sp. KK5]|uniref:LuxR C-terminal-related transcriptional regulator n=1 Tax=Pelomonas sp. KK5 TaxID=1855730 RepID=UPI001E4F611B|nr:LuxR C-terminal-related transcriptional regulator [Pelomonas sp. KK5]
MTPPRVPRQLLPREALALATPRLTEVPALLVQAPAGYGKTSLLAQWRLELLARGSAVGWLTCQPRDDERRLLCGLALAVRTGMGRPLFGEALLERERALQPLEGLTLWLAEVAQCAVDIALLVDDADRLPPNSRALLAYLMRNQPPNLRVVIGARSDVELGLDDLLDYGQALRLGPAELRFSLVEALQLIRARSGDDGAFDADLAARLHEFSEGWPLGLQLLLAALSAGSDARELLDSLQGGAPDAAGLRPRLMALMFDRLSPADLLLLESSTIVDPIHPGLVAALTGTDEADARERLARLARDTPLLARAEQGDWLRLHKLARDHLRRRLQQERPQPEREDLHRRAGAWLQQQDMLEAAAHHAWESGQRELALDLAERSLYEALTQRGQQALVREWLDRLPEAELQRRPRLLLAAAWSLAVSNEHEAAERLVALLQEQPGIDDALRCECAMILGGAAIFADEPDRFAALHDPWATPPPQMRDPLLRSMHANRSALRRVLQGDCAQARLGLLQHRREAEQLPGARYVNHWADLILAMSHMWEGQVLRAEQHLAPALRQAEQELGRRSPLACMLAAYLAAAVWEQERGAEAQALLADRIDVLERSGLPQAVLLAYMTIVRIAAAEGGEHRALELLQSLEAVGEARRLPRLRLASLVEQMRLHARRYHAETCRTLLARLEELLARPELPQGPMWRHGVEAQALVARGHAALAAREWRAAMAPLSAAAEAARAQHFGRLQIEAQGLMALAMERCGEHAAFPLLGETQDLATTWGLQRVFNDAHPDLRALLRQLAERRSQAPLSAPAPLPAPAAAAPLRPLNPGSVLTPKEREVLDLLARNLSNKEAALAMQVGEETIKWHVKNLFAKLDAGTRKQAVARARILGFLPVLA